uniref:hypothetical protein n=1 Tax=Flavobacterium sp. TaxID=239 RepID=UPI00404B3329
MKFRFYAVLLFFACNVFDNIYSQTFFENHYVNHSSIAFFKSNAFSAINNGSTVFEDNRDDGFSLQTKHGLIFLRRFSFQIGTGLDYSIHLKNIHIPVLFDLKFYVYKYAELSPYFMIGKGTTLYNRLYNVDETYVGLGFAFETNNEFELIVELVRRIRDFDDDKNQIYFNTGVYGLSVGLKF